MKIATAIWIFFIILTYTMENTLAKDLPDEVTVSLLGPDQAALPPQKIARVKKSDEVKAKEDYFEIVGTLTPEVAHPPLGYFGRSLY
jgi:hypothetical protein